MGNEDLILASLKDIKRELGTQSDQLTLMDRTGHRLVFEMGDLRVQGWIPLSLTIDAAVDDRGAEELTQLLPGCTVEVTEEFTPQRGKTTGRGKERSVTKRISLSHTPQPDKQAVYAESVCDLLADQIAYIQDHGHSRRVTEENGRNAVALAAAAVELAGRSAG